MSPRSVIAQIIQTTKNDSLNMQKKSSVCTDFII